MKQRLFWSCLFVLLMPATGAWAELVVSHRSPYAPGDTHHDYSTALLQLALEKTRADYGGYKLNPIPPRNYTRALKALVDDTYPNLVIETSYEQLLTRNANLTFIKFPVDLGVLGYRVCFINPKLKASGARLTSLDDLRDYTFAHGVGWADTTIFRHNGLKVREIDNYDSVFLMVIGGRVDFFCRGINELLGEVEQFRHLKNLSIDEQFLLVYPLPRFFYLNAKNTEAKARLEAGLQRAFKDGSLLALWKEYYLPSIRFARLDGRQKIHLKNPLLDTLQPSEVPDFMELLSAAEMTPGPGLKKEN